nr:hypothetical protein CFP56_03742 [Quercus suber]
MFCLTYLSPGKAQCRKAMQQGKRGISLCPVATKETLQWLGVRCTIHGKSAIPSTSSSVLKNLRYDIANRNPSAPNSRYRRGHRDTKLTLMILATAGGSKVRGMVTCYGLQERTNCNPPLPVGERHGNGVSIMICK